MRPQTITNGSKIRVNKSYEAEPLEQQLRKIKTEGTGIDQTSPIIYTERKEGVRPEFDIRTDRWEIAREAMSKVHKEKIAKRDQKNTSDEEKTQKGTKGPDESIQDDTA